ncbi:High mobility group box domain [Trinorchestia longiramus]|nr:High mobility group box domain [Trinorchestia longiramus]
MESSPENSASSEKKEMTRSGRPRRRAARLSTSSPSKNLSKKEKKELSVSPVKGDCDVDAELSDFDDIDIKEDDDWDLPDDNSLLKLTDEDFQDDRSYDHLDIPAHDLELDNEDFEMDDETIDSEDVSKDSSSGMAQSLYLSEKAVHARAGGRDGQRRRKAQRKDKGKSRFTAYMLWAREVRADISKKHPELDFSAVNKKLGELWQLVPTAQKYNWKRRAKRLAVRLRQGGGAVAGKGASPLKAAVSSPARSSGQQHGSAADGSGGRQSGRRVSPSKSAKLSSPQRTQRGGSRGSQSRTPTSAADSPAPSGFKVTGTAAIDVASHMKLLGESLNNIGHKLKEHEGQIAVSGSLSVLLDSMLCVLGPLMCLTDQLEETRGAIEPETHAAILDNIAYIMPGIVGVVNSHSCGSGVVDLHSCGSGVVDLHSCGSGVVDLHSCGSGVVDLHSCGSGVVDLHSCGSGVVNTVATACRSQCAST